MWILSIPNVKDYLTALADLAYAHFTPICAGISICCWLAATYRCKSRAHHKWRSSQWTFFPDKKDFYFGLPAAPKAKMVYNSSDFGDYSVMTCLSWLSCGLCYGFGHLFTQFVGLASLFLCSTFIMRHGAQWKRVPVLLSHPVSTIFNALLHRFQNTRFAYFAQISLCLAEAALFSSGAIQQTQVYAFLKEAIVSHLGPARLTTSFWCVTFGGFYLHLALLSFYRLLVFCAHVWNHKHVFDFLSQTGWKKTLSFVPRSSTNTSSILYSLEELADHLVGLLHAFVTGIYTHVVALIPWFCCLKLVDASARSALDPSSLDATLCFMLAISWTLRVAFVENKIRMDFFTCDQNSWALREHWLGHHDLFEFNYLHGPHHDALPVGMIAVSDHGPLEGLLRHSFGMFDSFLCPPLAAYTWTISVKWDIDGHQYVPGVFPWSFPIVDIGYHHAEHHFLSMHPLGGCITPKAPDKPLVPAEWGQMACEVETWVSGDRYSPDNEVWNWFVKQVAELEKGIIGKERAQKMLSNLKGEGSKTASDLGMSKKAS